MTILDQIDQVTPDQLAAGLYELLYSGTADFETQEKMKDRRLVPIVATIVKTKGRPPFAPPDLPKDRTDRVVISAAYLLGYIASRDDREAIQALIDVMGYDNDRVKLAAATALGQLGATEGADKVVAFTQRMMEQGEVGALSKLTQVLAQFGNAEAKAGLEMVLNRYKGSEEKSEQHVVNEATSALMSIEKPPA